MAWDLGEIKSQVQLLTDRDNLTNKVTTWTNRACMELGTLSYFRKAMAVQQNVPLDAAVSTPTDQWVSNLKDDGQIVNIHHINMHSTGATTVGDETYYHQLERWGPKDHYNRFQGLAATYSASTPKQYAIPQWHSTNTTNGDMIPQIAPFPQRDTTDSAMEVAYLKAPDKVANDGDTNWLINRYFECVLCRVLCYAYVHLGDIEAYVRERKRLDVLVHQLMTNEEVVTANVPTRRGMLPETMKRGQF